MFTTPSSEMWSDFIKLLLLVARKEEADGAMSYAEERKWASSRAFQWKYPKSKADNSNQNSEVNKIEILQAMAKKMPKMYYSLSMFI